MGLRLSIPRSSPSIGTRTENNLGVATSGAARVKKVASAGARASMGVWGLSPQWGPGAKPLVRGPPEADDILTFETPNLTLF